MLALLLAAAQVPPMVSATLPMPPSAGTVAVALAEPDDADAATDEDYADAVGQALGAANFTSLPTPGHSRYIAQVSVVRQDRGIVATRVGRDPASAGVGSWGPVVRVPLGSHKTQLRDLVATTLNVRLIERAGQRQVWSGSAITVGTDSAAAAGKLARAVIASYPQTLAAPVSVP